MFNFRELPLDQRFMLISFVVLISVILLVGTIVANQIQMGIIERTGALTSFYLDSLLTHHLKGITNNNLLDQETRDEIAHIFAGSTFSEQVVSFKLWSPAGIILYSPASEMIGESYVNENLQQALRSGKAFTSISRLDDDENRFESQRWDRLIETYAPLRDEESGEIIAVVEFYQTTLALEQEVFKAQLSSWLVVILAGVIIFAALNSMILRASSTITEQQEALEENIGQLQNLLRENETLSDRVRRAAGRTTMLNERLLRRIASDLHDGPAQDIAYALLRIDDLIESDAGDDEGEKLTSGELVRNALSTALGEIRNVSSGLRIPELEGLSMEEIIRLAIREYQRKSGMTVTFEATNLPGTCPEPVRITLYRIVQESLTNSYQHARGAAQSVTAQMTERQLFLAISDDGGGFEQTEAGVEGHLGIAGMRERAEILGGTFGIDTDETGTTIHVQLPLTFPGADIEDGLDI